MGAITPARWRIMAYMRCTGCRLVRRGRGTGYTLDGYMWPIPTGTFNAMLSHGLLTHVPQLSNENDVYELSSDGIAALEGGPHS